MGNVAGRGRDGASRSGSAEDLSRYLGKQSEYHQTALEELQRGRKSSCWSWYILPTLPFIRNGQEVGSPINKRFALRDDAEGCAYVRTALLRDNYVAILEAVAAALKRGVAPRVLMGIDVPRLEASAKLFERLGGLVGDAALGSLCGRVLSLLRGESGDEHDGEEGGEARSRSPERKVD